MLLQLQKEVEEVALDPTDESEWADVILTAFVALLMLGLSPAEICALLNETQRKVFARNYPRTSENEVIAHVE